MAASKSIPLSMLRVVILLAAGYGMLAFGFNALAQSSLFPTQYCSRRPVPGTVTIRQPDGSALVALFLPNPAARFTLWYFHGNAEDLGDIEPTLRRLQAEGFAVFAFDYPGYGLSGGRPSESSLNEATRTMSRYLRETLHVLPENVIIYGRSVGGGPAVELATHDSFAGLVLQGTFTSAYRVVTRWPLFPFDKFKNLKKLPAISCPVYVMHGRSDEVIPFRHGEALSAAATGLKRSLWVDHAGHNDFVERAGERYWAGLREFTELCTATRSVSRR